MDKQTLDDGLDDLGWLIVAVLIIAILGIIIWIV